MKYHTEVKSCSKLNFYVYLRHVLNERPKYCIGIIITWLLSYILYTLDIDSSFQQPNTFVQLNYIYIKQTSNILNIQVSELTLWRSKRSSRAKHSKRSATPFAVTFPQSYMSRWVHAERSKEGNEYKSYTGCVRQVCLYMCLKSTRNEVIR